MYFCGSQEALSVMAAAALFSWEWFMSALYFLCVYMYVVCVHVCASILKVCIHVEVRSLPQSLSTLSTEAEFQLNPESTYIVSLSCCLALGVPCLPLLNAGILGWPLRPHDIYMCS